MKKSEILIIGAGGHLGSLLIQKIHLSKFFAKIFALLRNIKIAPSTLRNVATCVDNKSLSSYVSEQIDVVMLCTKPQDAVAALQELPSSIKNKPSLFISVAASLNTSVIKECVGSNHCIARVIPNVFLEKSHSITFVSHESCCEKCKKQVLDIFADTGEILVVPEVLLNKATVLGASMPAIVAYLVKISGGYYGFRFPQYLKSILVEITIKNGFTREEAEKIISRKNKFQLLNFIIILLKPGSEKDSSALKHACNNSTLILSSRLFLIQFLKTAHIIVIFSLLTFSYCYSMLKTI